MGSPPLTLQEGPGQIASGLFCVAVIASLRNNNYNLTRDINGRILKEEGDL